MMTRYRILVLAVVMIAGASLAFAGGGPEPKGKGGVATIGLAWNVKNDALIVAWEDYMVAYSKEYGKKVGREFKWIINVADGDPARQNSNIEDLISQKVDLIITRPEDGAAIGAAIKSAKKAGIPIVTFDRESQTEQPTAHVGASSEALAYDTASAFAKLLKEKGVKGIAIELQGDLRDQNAVYFHNGWAKAEAETGAWKTVVTIPTEWKPEKFQSGLSNALEAHPEANCIFVASDFAMDAVRAALEKAGRWIPTGQNGHMWMSSMGATTAGLPALEGGYLDVTGVWDAWYHSRKAVEVIAKILSGEKLDGQKFLVSGRITTPSNVKTLENLWSRDYVKK